MRLVYPGGQSDWALVDQDAGVLRHLAGGLSIWSPRVAFGEGRLSLPINGRTEPLRQTSDLSVGRHFRRVFGEPLQEGDDLLAAIMGSAPQGLHRPARCIVGYVAVARRWDQGPPVLGPVLMTVDEFGRQFPDLVGRDRSVAEVVGTHQAVCGLRTGDVVLLGRAALTSEVWAALRSASAHLGAGAPTPQIVQAAQRARTAPSVRDAAQAAV